MKKEEVMQAVARGWCSEANSGKVMDTDLAMAITEEILKMPCEANLGCATTWELLDEVRARIEVSGNLDYKTVGDGEENDTGPTTVIREFKREFKRKFNLISPGL